MFAQWRLTLRQAEEAVRADRFEEALELARRPEVADHCQAGQLRNRVALRLVERACEHARQGHSQAAWHDLRQAELAGAPSTKLVQVRGELTDRGAQEVQAALDTGAPNQAMTLADELRILILHGVLHLMGYDHESDSGQMERRERFLRRRLGLE